MPSFRSKECCAHQVLQALYIGVRKPVLVRLGGQIHHCCWPRVPDPLTQPSPGCLWQQEQENRGPSLASKQGLMDITDEHRGLSFISPAVGLECIVL